MVYNGKGLGILATWATGFWASAHTPSPCTCATSLAVWLRLVSGMVEVYHDILPMAMAMDMAMAVATPSMAHGDGCKNQ